MVNLNLSNSYKITTPSGHGIYVLTEVCRTIFLLYYCVYGVMPWEC